jgi:hypothetical protein
MSNDMTSDFDVVELETEIKKIRRELGGFDYATCEFHLAKLLVERGYGRVTTASSSDHVYTNNDNA